MAFFNGFSLAPPDTEPGKAWPGIVSGLFVAFGGVLFGYDFLFLSLCHSVDGF